MRSKTSEKRSRKFFEEILDARQVASNHGASCVVNPVGGVVLIGEGVLENIEDDRPRVGVEIAVDSEFDALHVVFDNDLGRLHDNVRVLACEFREVGA